MRAVTVNSTAVPSARVARTRTGLRGASPSAMPVRSYDSSPVSPSRPASSPSPNTSGSTPMKTRLLRWMRSKLVATTARTPSSMVPLAAQSREDPEPYSAPASTTSGVPSSR